MAAIDNIRNSIIERLLTINNKEYLKALQKLVEESTLDDLVELTEEQKIMLQLSDDDIKKNRLISQSQLDKNDLKWLKEQ